MSSSRSSSSPVNTGGILARAKRLGTTALLAVAPLAAPAATLTLDYSVVGDYSSSGWFIGVPSEEGAAGIILPNGFKLWGDHTIHDSEFVAWSDYYDATTPRGSFSGAAFAWGGKITGGTTYEDKLTAPFDFTIAFTNGLPDSYSTVNVGLNLGYSYSPFVPPTPETGYNVSLPSGSSDSWSTSYSAPGSYHELSTAENELSVNLTDSAEDLYWFVLLTVNWSNEFVSWYNWSPQSTFPTVNGDALTITIPQNSIDVGYVVAPGQEPENPPTNRVPDSGSTLALLGLSLANLAWLRRRR